MREEYRSTFLQSAVLAYNMLLDSTDLVEACLKLEKYRWKNLGGSPRKRARARVMLLTLMQQEAQTRERALQTLDRWIAFEMMEGFEEGMTEIRSETTCCRVVGEPEKTNRDVYVLSVSCRVRPQRPCIIEEFWGKRTSDLRGFSKISTARRELKALRRAASEVLGGKAPRGQRCWGKLSDAVIAGEAPNGSDILTSNVADFSPICAIADGDRKAVNFLEERSVK